MFNFVGDSFCFQLDSSTVSGLNFYVFVVEANKNAIKDNVI